MDAIDHQTGEYLGRIYADRYDRAAIDTGYCPDAARIDRFRLLNLVREILPEHRTAQCLRHQRREGGFTSDGLPRIADVEVWKTKKHERCHYKNLTVCGRVWTCPVCTAKINEGRRLELKAICKAHESASGSILMITKTFAHDRFDDLSGMLTGLSKANDRFWRSPDIVRLRKSLGLVGYIRTTEVTWGEVNGWHPHYHELWLIKNEADLEHIKTVIFKKWRQFIEKVGLGSPNEKYGVHVRGASDAWGYITKFGTEDQWDYSHEMTKHHVKKGKAGRYTPFSLLKAFRGDYEELEPQQAKILFREYAQAIHGKRQLQYSKGLKKLYEIAEVEDQELAETTEESSIHLATIDNDTWKKILWSDKKQNARATVLSLAQRGVDFMWSYIDGLPDPPNTY